MTQARPLTVVIDTTEFRPDLLLSKRSWQQTRLWALKGQLRLWVPEVVVREAVRHYHTQLDQHLAKLADADDAMSKLYWTSDPRSGIEDQRNEIGILKVNYELWLRERLGRVGATILPLPHMTHDTMLRRTLNE